jgi:hypothetical protein
LLDRLLPDFAIHRGGGSGLISDLVSVSGSPTHAGINADGLLGREGQPSIPNRWNRQLMRSAAAGARRAPGGRVWLIALLGRVVPERVSAEGHVGPKYRLASVEAASLSLSLLNANRLVLATCTCVLITRKPGHRLSPKDLLDG